MAQGPQVAPAWRQQALLRACESIGCFVNANASVRDQPAPTRRVEWRARQARALGGFNPCLALDPRRGGFARGSAAAPALFARQVKTLQIAWHVPAGGKNDPVLALDFHPTADPPLLATCGTDAEVKVRF